MGQWDLIQINTVIYSLAVTIYSDMHKNLLNPKITIIGKKSHFFNLTYAESKLSMDKND
jgi:hypothetical protein